MKKLIVLILLILSLLCYIRNNVKNEPVTDLYIEPTNIITVEDKLPQTEEISRIITVTAYGYCPCVKCCGKSNGITSTGVKATAGRTIAVDTNVIPLGSTVVIDGKEYIAEDTGGGIKGNKIDVFHDTHTDALRFGKREIEIEVRE